MSEEKQSSPILKAEETPKEAINIMGSLEKGFGYLRDYFKNSKARLVGLVFVGMYAGAYGWLLIHILATFWDIYLPLNIKIGDYFYYNHGFLVYLVLLTIFALSLFRILVRPLSSQSESNRWHLGLVGPLLPLVFYYSNMAGEPLDEIGGSWFGEDLRLPAFFSKDGFTFLHMFFVSDLIHCFKSHDNYVNSGLNFVFRPYLQTGSFANDIVLSKYRENWRGILAYAYLYASYWFIIFVVASARLERIVLYAAIVVSRWSIGTALDFTNGRSKFFLLFAPICACFRAYYAYDEWSAQGPRWIFAVKLAYCLSQIVIFAGWYSSPNSLLAKWTQPYITDEIEEERVDVLGSDVTEKKED